MKVLSRSMVTALVLLGSAGLGCGDDASSSSSGGGDAGAGGQGASGGAGGTGGLGGAGGAGGAASGGGGAGGGEPVELVDNTWQFINIEGSTCMDGSPTGIGINPSSTSDNVVFFLQGGNACFNAVSCAITANPNGYDADSFVAELPDIESSDYFDRENPDNPLRDFTFVYVPYCTGDVHAGQASDVTVGNKVRQFQGYGNVGRALDFVKPYFPAVEKVVLSGVSAGGFGAAYNYDRVAGFFGDDVKVTLIDDSGPPMAEEFVPQCLQEHFKNTWGIQNTLPPDCDECQGATWLEEYMRHVISKYPTRSLGVVSTSGDATIRSFWGFGNNDCAPLAGAPGPYSEQKYQAGLEDLRDRVTVGGRFGLYLIEGSTEHVLLDNPIGSVTVDGVGLHEWIKGAINEDPTWGSVPTVPTP